MELTKITLLSDQLGISSRSLRYYEQIGLIKSVRPENEKYRHYDVENIQRLKQIMILRKMQVSVKDIIRIYESRDMSVVVETFARNLNELDQKIKTLGELRRIVNDFLQAMITNGIKQISALPLIYEEINRRMEEDERMETIKYDRLNALSETLAAPRELEIIALPAMRMLSSLRLGTSLSDAEGFCNWLDACGIPSGAPGMHKQFEYQDAAGQVVILLHVEKEPSFDCPFVWQDFCGGLYAVGGVYVDEDMVSFHRGMMSSFDENPNYQLDYGQGDLRGMTLAQAVLSPDSRRERVLLLVPVKERLPNASLHAPGSRIEEITVEDIERQNPILSTSDVAMGALIPILSPHYQLNDRGEAEYIPWISDRKLSTNVRVKLPFRVDITYRIDRSTARFGYGAAEGSLRVYHADCVFAVGMENNAQAALSKEALAFRQPVFKDYFVFPELGKIDTDTFNTLTWIVGVKHFALIVNGELRYCAKDMPYMSTAAHQHEMHPIIIGGDGQGTIILRGVQVSQLKRSPKALIKGEIIMNTRQSNNIIPVIHQLITMRNGENYWFNGCAKYVMECLGEKEYTYSFFAGLTGDNFAQVYPYDRFRGEGVTEHTLSVDEDGAFIESVFEKCGYASTYVLLADLRKNMSMYVQTLMSYIDRGIPVIWQYWDYPVWRVIVGYEEFGKTLLYLTEEKTQPERVTLEEALCQAATEHWCTSGWVFIGEKQREVNISTLYLDVILNLPKLLTTGTDHFYLGAQAFRQKAAEIEGGRFDGMKPEEFDDWAMHKSFVCALATNASCCYDFLNKAFELNPDLTFIEDIVKEYKQMGRMWENEDGKDLEALGGGFNVTLEALQDKVKRSAIAEKLKLFAQCVDRVVDAIGQFEQ